MKNGSRKWWLVGVIVLISGMASSLESASAQAGTRLIAVADGTIMLFAEPNDRAELIGEVPDAAVMDVLGADETGNWLAVATMVGLGYVMLDDAIVMDLPVLAPLAYLEHARTIPLLADPAPHADRLGDLPVGTVVSMLGINGQFAYVDTPLGIGWTVAVEWTLLPDDTLALLTGEVDAPVWADADVGAVIIRMLSPMTLVYGIGAPVGDFVPVLLPEGLIGYMQINSVIELPRAYVEANARASAGAGVYAEPVHDVERIAGLLDGTRAFFLGWVDGKAGDAGEFIEIYHPDTGVVYGVSASFTPPYAVATIQQTRSVVRTGPNDNIYDAIAILNPYTRVIVKGINVTGAWVEVALPFAEVDFAYHGVAGWARDFLFVDDFQGSDLDKSILIMTE